jgi:hypothetical protein
MRRRGSTQHARHVTRQPSLTASPAVLTNFVDPAGEGYLIRTSTTGVEAWSTARLPFEPRGWLICFRQDLRLALSVFPRPLEADQILHAIYAAKASEFVDTENVLLYNVGSGPLRHLMTNGVRFERGYMIPPPPAFVLCTGPLHYHRYALAPRHAGYEHWRSGRLLARFDPVRIEQITKPGPIFIAIRGSAQPPLLPTTTPTRFGICLTLQGPRTGGLAGLIKPLLDGVICAYHHHDGRDLDDVVQRLHRAGLGPALTLSSELQDERWQVLGSRRLVKPFRDGVQWNPADDACLAADIQMQSQPVRSWQLSGSLVEIG